MTHDRRFGWLACLALVLCSFCLPLFIGLGSGDLRGDEGIYSFGVDRMLEAGDWLVPKSSPGENDPFLEKPPLKFWIVALPIRLGLLPHNEFGLRFWDALFGSIAFLYVFAIGVRLGGPICGVIAVLTLFAQGSLLFEHGLRSNNMEGPLVLCYCGGIYHYLRAVSLEDTASPRAQPRMAGHVVAVALYFVLGFMTKFLAAIFLPAVLAIATLATSDARQRVAHHWRAWIGAKAIAAALILPWFVYAHLRFGSALWHVMFTEHIYGRMTQALSPDMVHPWYFYVSSMYHEFQRAGVALWVAVGLLMLVVRAVIQRSFDAMVILLWIAIPTVLISAGASRLYHYEYPFLPGVALAVGYAATLVLPFVSILFQQLVAAHDRWISNRSRLAVFLSSPPLRLVWILVAVLSVGVAVGGLALGEVRLTVDGVLLRSGGILRPILLAVLFAILGGLGRGLNRALAFALVISVLPLPAYVENLRALTAEPHPMSASSTCLSNLEATTPDLARGLLLDLPTSSFGHAANYYLRRIRPWVVRGPATRDRPWVISGPSTALDPYLTDPSIWRPVLRKKESDDAALPGMPSPATLQDDMVLLLPGPYAACNPAPW